MIRGALGKSIRETWPVTAGFAMALLIVQMLMAYAMPVIFDQLAGSLLQLEFFQRMLSALLGTTVGAAISPDAIHALPWVHPVVLIIWWANAIIIGSRIPAGEIDRGTVDVLLALPISRHRLYLCEIIVMTTSGLILTVACLLGNTIGLAFSGVAEAPPTGARIIVALNLLLLYLTVAGLTSLVSATSDRRGRAMAWVFSFLLAAFFLNFLAQFWAPAEIFVFLSPLQYHQPLPLLAASQTPAPPWGDWIVLTLSAATFWMVGGVCFTRRDICTT